MKLSIIIPYYNAKEYTDELLDCLDKQINDDVEVILVDDGSKVPYKTRYKWCNVIRQKNKRCSGARNTGLDNAQGDYIQFIDADDLVPDYFISKLFQTIDEYEPDVIDYSWKSLSTEGTQHNHKLTSIYDRLTNPSVCTRAFKRSYIGSTRFNENKDSTEDEDFSRKLGYLITPNINRVAITDYMYFYRTAVDDSKIKRFKRGIMNTKRIVYYYNHVTADMTDLVDEIRHEDERNEVWLITNRCDIPELKRYCQISKPVSIWGHYLRGEPYSGFIQIKVPIKTQVVVYCEHANMIGGISTFLYNFCYYLKKYYDIIVLYDRFDIIQISRLKEIVPVMHRDNQEIFCDTIILNRLTDEIPVNITYKQSIQVCHACVQTNYKIPQDRDILVNVSEASKRSWGAACEDGIVIHNMLHTQTNEALMLVSATRVKAGDKGENDSRILKLANMLNDSGISFVWLNFSDKPIDNPPKNFYNVPATLKIQDYIKKADYLVQLSDREAYSYSVLEALSLNTAVLATPFASLFEQGFEDGKTGYVIPFDMDFDVKKLLNVPKFEYKYDNESIIKQWRKILGNTKPISNYKPPESILVEITYSYKDLVLGRQMHVGDIVEMSPDRVRVIVDKMHFGKIVLGGG